MNDFLTLRFAAIVGIPTFGAILTITELASYGFLFCYVWKHDNKLASEILSKDVIQKRNRTNALSRVGCFATWAVNIIYVIGVGFVPVIFLSIRDAVGVSSIAFQSNNSIYVREVTSFFKFYDYLIIPFVQIKTSPPLKRFIESRSK